MHQSENLLVNENLCLCMFAFLLEGKIEENWIRLTVQYVKNLG